MYKTLMSGLITTGLAFAGLPQFNSTPIEVSSNTGANLSDVVGDWMFRGSNGSPEFVDWDGDGLKDMLVVYLGIVIGAIGGGYMNVFINHGTATEPLFTTGFRAPIYVDGA